MYIQIAHERNAEMLLSQLAIIKLMTKGSPDITISQDQAPEGWVSENVGPTVIVSIQADAKVDITEETKKLQKQLALARQNQEKINKRLSQPGYANAVPEAVKVKDLEKVSCLHYSFLPS